MADLNEAARRVELMRTASDVLEDTINFLEAAGQLDEIVLLLRTAENKLEDEVVKLDDQLLNQ